LYITDKDSYICGIPLKLTNMLCFISPQNDPHFNLASEEYFLKMTDKELFVLYINNPAIVAGKHQNLLGEINTEWVRAHKIILARRLSGGGTVYQDEGNLNFSFISNCPNLEDISYKRFTFPIVLALKSLGINAEYSGRNDLLLNNKKISGNAMHIFKKRVLCHGTLLFNAELKNLSSALKIKQDRYFDKSIKSIPSKVVNISEFLPNSLSMCEFSNMIFAETLKYLDSPIPYKLNETEESEIRRLSQEKYSTWEWILGYSPKYIFRNEIFLNGQIVKFELNVEKGIIRSYNFMDNDHINGDITFIFNHLLNSVHDFKALIELLTNAELKNLLKDISVEEFCNHLF
jgi:lipoate---protein ligase